MKKKRVLFIMSATLLLTACGNVQTENVTESTNEIKNEATAIDIEDFTEKISIELTHDQLSNPNESSVDELLDLFLAGDIAAEYADSSEGEFYITDLPLDEEDAFSYSIGDRVDLDNDGELELILNGIYGGKYLDAREGKIFVLDEGWGTAGVLSYTSFDGQNWIVHSDTTHGGRYLYDFTLYDGTGKVVDTFQLTQEFWETPEVPDGPGTVYTYRNEQITKEEYEELKEKMLHN